MKKSISTILSAFVIVLLPVHLGSANDKETTDHELSPVAKEDRSHHYEASSVKAIHQFKKSPSEAATLRAIEIDLGGSTDLSPRTSVYVTFRRSSEMLNTWASYHIGYFWSVEGYKEEKEGVYSFEGEMFVGDDGPDVRKVKVVIDPSNLWAEDRNRKDMEDGPLSAKIKIQIVTEQR